MALFTFLCVFVFAMTVRGDSPTLEIQPSTDIYKPIGSSLAVTCRPSVQDPKLITQLEWRDPKGRRIETTKKASPIHVQNLGGEFGLVLVFSSLIENNAGNYTCSAMYSNTVPISNSVVINTFLDITFVDAPESQYPRAGEDFVVKCKVQGRPSPIVDWTKNEEAITSNEKYATHPNGLLIRNVRESDDGVYKCMAVVLATGQIKSRNIKVEVIIPPAIQPMAPISVIDGETASARCIASGKPPPTYTWIKLKHSQDLSKTDRFDVKKNTGELIINRVEFYDDDMYKCTAENPAGRTESTVKINVLVKPKIFELLNVTAPVDTNTKLICKTQGRPIPKIMFRKLSSKEPFKHGQQEDKRIIIEQENFEEKGESFGTLIVERLNRTDDGLYECIAENSAGTAYKNGHITVEFPPTFERTQTLPQAWAWGNRPGNITCIPEAIPNATIIWKYNNFEIKDSQNFRIEGQGPISHLIVKPLHDARFYANYECVASNKHGTKSIFLSLREARVPESVIQAKPLAITATTVKFSIEPPKYFDSLPIRSFTVQYRRERDVSWDFARNYTWSFMAPYILEGLVPENTYFFRFAARNDVGLGPWTETPPILMPRRSAPAEPKIQVPMHNLVDDNATNRQDSFIQSPYSDQFELRWNVPIDNGDPIDSYLIRYCATQKVNGNWRDLDCSEEIRVSVLQTSYNLQNLLSDTIYKVELRAHNAIGASSPAQIKVKTSLGIDPIIPYNGPAVSNAAIIGIVIGAVIVVLLLVDLTCFCVNRAGILAFFCNRSKEKTQEDDPKLGSLYSWRFPLPYCSYKAAPAHPNSLNLPLPVKLAPSLTPTEDERQPLNGLNGESRNMSVEFDGKQVHSKPGEYLGKHSAV